MIGEKIRNTENMILEIDTATTTHESTDMTRDMNWTGIENSREITEGDANLSSGTLADSYAAKQSTKTMNRIEMKNGWDQWARQQIKFF